ncbi:unnamed protein product, partial [marine sediment metagenome]
MGKHYGLAALLAGDATKENQEAIQGTDFAKDVHSLVQLLNNQLLIKDGETGAWLDSDSLHNIKEVLATLGGNVVMLAQLDRDTQSGDYTLTAEWQTLLEVSADFPQIIEQTTIGLENMRAGDTVEIQIQAIKKPGGEFSADNIIWAKSYSDVQAEGEKRIFPPRHINQYGYRIQARQTACGDGYISIDIETFQSGRIEAGGGGGIGGWTLSIDMPTGRKN